ncbi:MAG: AAA family ATPase, partial [Candidatus Eisenbacteria bacterium]|nr:AAA family ATPase [Candidatus Eisenbacteria bacterium]
CDLDRFEFDSTAELPSFDGIIGQDRAVAAIELGLKMRSKGYNVYVAGMPGTGRTTTVKHLLRTLETGRGVPPDIVYVHNFKNPDMPRAIRLPAGQGCRLKRDMEVLIGNMRRNIAQIYESEDYKQRIKALIEEFKEREKTILRSFEERIKKENFALIQVQLGPFSKPEIAPVIAGEPVTMEQLEAMTSEGKFSQEEFERLKKRYDELSTAMEQTFKASRNLKRELREAMAKLQKEFGSPAVSDYIKDLKAEYEHPDILTYLDEVRDAILENMQRFTDGEESHEQQAAAQAGQPRAAEEAAARFRDFAVNVLVDNSKTKAPPVIVETSPNYRNLFGTIERVVDRSGHWVSDFSKIKAGSLLRANGGTLVINLMDAIIEPGVWVALKRTLKYQKIDIQTFDPFYLYSLSALKPEPIELDLKVVVLGDAWAYQILFNYDEDFPKIFKVKAEFDRVMKKDHENVTKYVNFATKITSEEELQPMAKCGVGALVEHGIRLAGRQTKISTRFSEIADVIREADLWAREEKAPQIKAQHVKQAIKARRQRVNLSEEKIQELFEEGILMVDTEGSKIGQINGLSVLSVGDYAFGQPSRITVKCSLGRAGIVNIEREADLSGKTHNKGVLILEGYFRSLFAEDKPLTIHATICFEQAYGGIDGDSASSTEVYALLSALSGLPLRQDIAVTGSVNQHGEVQPIGGVNEKVEGFYAVCKARGLTGRQGVMIPAVDVADLMLEDEIVEAVAQGRFHIFAIANITEGIEILTGVPAGARGKEGHYPPNTVFGKVDETLLDYADRMKSFLDHGDDDGP